MPRGVPRLHTDPGGRHLPNEGSSRQTAASFAIDLHYAKLAILERWNWERFIRLASFLNVTPYELGSFACIPHPDVDNFRKRNLLRPSQRAAALVLTLIESHVAGKMTTDVIADPFPKLSSAIQPCTT